MITISAIGLVLAAAVPAAAQDTNEEARSWFQLGVHALDDGRNREAIEALEHSRRLREVPATDFNLGLAYRGVGEVQNAVAAFERYLAHPAQDAGPAELAAVRQTLAELRTRLVTLEVSVAPSSAMLTIDGRPLPMSNGVATVDPGQHVIAAAASGYVIERRTLTLSPGAHERIEISLRSAHEYPMGRIDQPRARPGGPAVGPIVVTVAGIAMLGAAAALFGIAQNGYANAASLCGGTGTDVSACASASDPVYASAHATWSSGVPLTYTADVLVGVGAVALVGGVTWWVLSRRPSRSEGQSSHANSGVTAFVSPSGFVVGLHRDF